MRSRVELFEQIRRDREFAGITVGLTTTREVPAG